MFIYFLYYEDEVIYVGSTKKFKERMDKHRSRLKNGYKQKIYEFMRDKNLLFENLKTYKFETNLQTKFELTYLEGIYIRLFKPICNEIIAGRSRKEYYKDNKEQLIEYHREYQKNNKEQISEYQKEYKKNNKEQLSEYKREYYENNKEQIKEYYEKNKEQINEKRRERRKQKNTINCIRYLFK